METEEEIEELRNVIEKAPPYKPVESPISKLGKVKVWTDKEGNKLTPKEFLSRWKEGMKGITPLQQVKTQMFGTRIILLGLLCGIIFCIMGIKNLWWLLIILVGGLFNTLVQYLGLWQKKNIYVQTELNFREVLK